MKNSIRIVTDSTADLPNWFVEKNNIKIVPLHINFPDASYLDGIELTAKDFYPMLTASGDDLPKTSTPTLADFRQAYQEILDTDPQCEILSIHLSGGLSSTVNIAESAAKTFPENIKVFDSRNISFGMGLQVFEAVEMIENAFSLDHILERLALVAKNTETMFCLDTLEYLRKGGRIGKVTAFVGTMLNLKPIIHVKDGVYESFDKVRSQRQAIQKMLDRGTEVLEGRVPKRLGVIHGACEEMATTLKEKAEETYHKAVDVFTETGAVIGTHTGPGTLGMTICHL
jgi:DegV family protein with EDD domain